MLFVSGLLRCPVRGAALSPLAGSLRAYSSSGSRHTRERLSSHAVSISTINANVKNASYAVRGAILLRSTEVCVYPTVLCVTVQYMHCDNGF
jgi:hypothetical protein